MEKFNIDEERVQWILKYENITLTRFERLRQVRRWVKDGQVRTKCQFTDKDMEKYLIRREAYESNKEVEYSEDDNSDEEENEEDEENEENDSDDEDNEDD